MSEVTRILEAVEKGDRQAANELLPLVYEELRKLAAAHLANERPGQTLQPTALVHEAYLRMVGPANIDGFESRKHFLGAAAQAMRRILVENARRKRRIKRGGRLQRKAWVDGLAVAQAQQICELDEALTRLACEDSLAAQVLELHFFGGLSHEQVARTLQITIYEARMKRAYAQAWVTNAIKA